MKTVQTSARISAPVDRVWQVLTEDLPQDTASFGIIRLEGRIGLNERLRLWSEVSPERAFSLKVTSFTPPRTMVWQGGMPFGLFTGTRTFRLTPEDEITLFEMHEVFSGLLSGLITKSMPDLTPGFEKFARTLKEKAEAKT